jgi:hypothetical protein
LRILRLMDMVEAISMEWIEIQVEEITDEKSVRSLQ